MNLRAEHQHLPDGGEENFTIRMICLSGTEDIVKFYLEVGSASHET
jgi:hypothetical protein